MRRVERLEPLADSARDRGGVVPLVLVRRVRYVERVETWTCAQRDRNATQREKAETRERRGGAETETASQ